MIEKAIFFGFSLIVVIAASVLRRNLTQTTFSPVEHSGIAQCVEGECWIKRADTISLEKVSRGLTAAVELGDEVITLGRGSILAVTLPDERGSFRVRNTSLIQLIPGLDAVDLEQGLQRLLQVEQSQDTWPSGGTGKPKVAKKAAEKKATEASGQAADKTQADKAGASDKRGAGQVSDVAQASVYYGKVKLKVRSPFPGKTYVALKMPAHIAVALTSEGVESAEQLNKIRKWKLVRIKDSKTFETVSEFELREDLKNNSGGLSWYVQHLRFDQVGEFALLPSEETPDIKNLSVRFEVVGSAGYRKKMAEVLKGLQPKEKLKMEILTE